MGACERPAFLPEECSCGRGRAPVSGGADALLLLGCPADEASRGQLGLAGRGPWMKPSAELAYGAHPLSVCRAWKVGC